MWPARAVSEQVVRYMLQRVRVAVIPSSVPSTRNRI